MLIVALANAHALVSVGDKQDEAWMNVRTSHKAQRQVQIPSSNNARQLTLVFDSHAPSGSQNGEHNVKRCSNCIALDR